MVMTRYCRFCKEWFVVAGVFTTGTCPYCAGRPEPEQTPVWTLSYNDLKLLKQLSISPD